MTIICVICGEPEEGFKYFQSCERWTSRRCLLTATRVRTTYTFPSGVEFFSIEKAQNDETAAARTATAS